MWKLATAILIPLLVLSIGMGVFNVTHVAYGEYMSLGVAVSPSTSPVKIGVNQTYTLTGCVLNGTGPFRFEWRVNPTCGNFDVEVNGRLVSFVNGSAKTFYGETLTVKYPTATENDYISVSLTVTDKGSGFIGRLEYPIAIYDPYTTSTQYLNSANAADFTYKIETDRLGFYRSIRGVDMAIVTSSTADLAALETATLALMTSGGTLKIIDGRHDYSVTVPEDCAVAEQYYGEYRRFINVADSKGSPLTISVDDVEAGYYMAQDSQMNFLDGWSSTNASYVFNTALSSTDFPSVYFLGSFAITSPIQISRNGTYLHGNVEGSLISASTDINMIDFRTDSSLYGCTLENFKLNGTNTASRGINAYKATGNGLQDSTIQNVYINNVLDAGIRLYNAYKIGLYNVRINEGEDAVTTVLPTDKGIFLETSGGAIVIDGAHIHCTNYSIYLSGGYGLEIKNCDLYYNARAALYTSTVGYSRMSVTGNTINGYFNGSNSQLYGFYLHTVKDSVFSENTFNGIAQYAIVTQNNAFNVYSGNIFASTNSQETDNTYSVVKLGGSHEKLIGNTFSAIGETGNNPKYLIEETTGASSNEAIDNTMARTVGTAKFCFSSSNDPIVTIDNKHYNAVTYIKNAFNTTSNHVSDNGGNAALPNNNTSTQNDNSLKLFVVTLTSENFSYVLGGKTMGPYTNTTLNIWVLSYNSFRFYADAATYTVDVWRY
ncbi:MAG: right-handed parallel beta-helix repeat-containing protein [Atribacterota bacterium]|nr:right-handed parallel beta-helix repeat-containing protein [Atribacterota bacterium]